MTISVGWGRICPPGFVRRGPFRTLFTFLLSPGGSRTRAQARGARAVRRVEREMAGLVGICGKNPTVVIWVSWYKKSSGKATDLTEDVIHGYALANGLVDIKVCAVSDEWSGLKLVVPVAKRPGSICGR
jgi:hypothetical protein